MFYSIEESLIPLYADAYLVDATNRCLLVSLWGSEAAVQEFFARLTLPNHEFGLSSFNLSRPGDTGKPERHVIGAGQAKHLQKLTAKTPASGILGAYCHVWLYAPDVRELDRTGGNGYLLQLKEESIQQFETRAWAMVKELSQIPLLDDWSDLLMEKIRAQDGIAELKGSGVAGFHILIDQKVLVELVQRGLRDGWLKVPEITYPNSLGSIEVEGEIEDAAPVALTPLIERKRGQLDLLI